VARAETKALDEVYDCVDQGPLSEDWGPIPDSRDATASLSRHALLTAAPTSVNNKDFDSAAEKNAKLLLGNSTTDDAGEETVKPTPRSGSGGAASDGERQLKRSQ
jgi:hypothetical protein